MSTHPMAARPRRISILALTVAFLVVLTGPAAASERSVRSAGKHHRKADHAVVARAKSLRHCQRRHHPDRACRARHRRLQHAGKKLSHSERRLRRVGRHRGHAARRRAAQRAPRVRAHGAALRWHRVAGVKTYVVGRRAHGGSEQYSVVNGTSTTPAPQAGARVSYRVRTATKGSRWSPPRTISYPSKAASADPQTAPVLSVDGRTLRWTGVAGVGDYVLVSRVAGRADQYTAVSGTSYEPSPVPGATVRYAVRTAVDGAAWSLERTISYPDEPSTPVTHDPTPDPAPASGGGRGYDGFGAGNWPGANWRPYSDSSPFNQRIPAGTPSHPDSAAMVRTVLSWNQPGNLVAGSADTPDDWSHPTYYAQPGDPLFTLHATKPWGRSPIEGMTIPIPDAARPAGGGDGHMTVVTPDGWEYDFWQVESKPQGGGTMTFSFGGRTRIDGDGLDSYATAAKFGNLAGVIRAPELAAGHIDHALFIVLRCTSVTTDFGYGTQPRPEAAQGSYVYPASHGAAPCPEGTVAPPAGARFQLDMSDAQIAALAVPEWKKTILTALAHYGGYVGDTGGSGFGFQFESSTTYTAFGQPDPLVQLAQRYDINPWNGRYAFNMADGVDWQKYLRIIPPPAR